jgi:hypothetical protein
MKRLLLIGLFLLTACNSLTPQPSPVPTVTFTRVIPTPVPVSSPQGTTVTSTAVPSPTATVTPLPPKRYFTEEFDSAPAYWSTLYASGDSSHVDLQSENSTLTFEIYSQNTWLYAIYGAFEYDAVHVETRIESHGSEVNSMGLVCDYDEQEGWYEFNISNNGTYSVLYGQWLTDGIARYTPVLNDTSNHIAAGNSINEIGLDCYDDIVQLYLNGEILRKLNVAHIGLIGGKVGLAVGSFEESPVILAFDWVKVSEP